MITKRLLGVVLVFAGLGMGAWIALITFGGIAPLSQQIAPLMVTVASLCTGLKWLAKKPST